MSPKYFPEEGQNPQKQQTGADQSTIGNNTDIVDFIRKNYVHLSKMEVNDVLIGYLLQEGIVTFDDMDRILSEDTKYPARDILKILRERKKCTPEQLITALRFTHQAEIVDYLNYEQEMALNVQWSKAPDTLEHVTTTKTSIKLQWKQVDDSETLLGYLVEQSPSGYNEWKSAHESISLIPKGNKPQLAISDYRTYQAYDFRVKAVHYINGQRVYSDPRSLQNLVAKLPGQPHPPRNLQVECCHNGSNYVTLTWAEPVTIEADTSISYIVQKGLVHETEVDSIYWENCATTEDCECRLHHELTVGRSYCFRVFSKNKKTGTESEATVMKGPEIRITVDVKGLDSVCYALSSVRILEDTFKHQKISFVAKEKGSVILVFSCDDLDSLIELRKMYHQGEVNQVLQKLFVSDKLRARGVTPEDLTVTIRPENFTAGCRHLLLTNPTDKGFRVVRIGAAHSKGQIQKGRSQEYPVHTKPRQSRKNPHIEGLDLETLTSQYRLTRVEDENKGSLIVMDHEDLTTPSGREVFVDVPDTIGSKENEPLAVPIQEDNQRSDIIQDQQSAELSRTAAIPDSQSRKTSLAPKMQKLTMAADPEQKYGKTLREAIHLPSLANKLQDLELCLKSQHRQEVGYGQALRDAIVSLDQLMEVEVLKSLGDLHLKKAKLSKDSAEFDKAAGLYAAALLRCTDPDMGETLEHRVGYMEKLSRQLLQGYTPHFRWLSPDYWGAADNNVLRVAEICYKLDRSIQKSRHSIEDSYTQALVSAITSSDMMLEQEVLKSLGDLYLEKGKKTSDVSQFSKAAAMYGKALTKCTAPVGVQTLLHRILYTVKVHESLKQQLSQRTKQKENRSTKKKRKVITRLKDNDTQDSGQYKERLRKGDMALQSADLDSAEQHFASALKMVHVRDPYIDQYQRELEPLQKLGDVYCKQGQQTGDGGDFVKAAALYNAAIARSSGEVMKVSLEAAIAEVEKSFVRRILCIDHNESKQRKKQHKLQLKEMRDQIKLEMDTINQQLDPYVHDEDDPCVKEIETKRAQAVRHLFENIAQQRKEFISLLVDECIGLMGPPPCKYALIGLGSQATGLVTPYSDLEFAILVEDESEECLLYFRNLTHYLHLKVVNLGETILPALGIKCLNDFYSDNPLDNWYYDSVTPRGFSFDGAMPRASKTPLGRQKSRGLIQAPGNMVTTLRTDATVYLREAYHLASSLRNPSLLVGDQVLVDRYVETVAHVLEAEEGKVALQLIHDILQDNMDDYDRQELTAKLIDMKKEIYRLPSLAVDFCALCSHVIPTSVWNTIDKMESTHIISTDNAHHLRVLVSISAELRLRTYIANGGQKETLSALSLLGKKDDSFIALQNILHITNVKQLHRYYYTAVPLKRALTAQYPPTVPPEFPPLFDNSSAVKQTMDFELLGDYRKTVSHYEQALQKYTDIHGKSTVHPDISRTLNNLGLAWAWLGDYQKTLSYYEQALQIMRMLWGESTAHPDIANTLNNLGSAWEYLGDYRKAIIYHEQALQMYTIIYGQSTAHPGMARSLTVLGSAWGKLGDYKKAISYYKQALQMNIMFWGESTAHPDIANTLNNLGSAWEYLGDYRKAISYHEQALQIYRGIHGQGASHPDIARLLNNLGSVYQYLGDCRQAISYIEQALQMYTIIYGQSTAHPGIARSLTVLGSAWGQLGDHRKTVSYYEKSLQMMKSIYGESTAHHDIASSLNNMGLVWSQLGDNSKAVSYLEQALQMYRIIYGDSTAHPETARSLNSLGSAWRHLGDYRKAVSYFEQALQMYTTIYGQSTAHPDIASLFHNIGSTWNQLGDDKKALSYYEKTLQIMKSIYGESTAHPDIASSLNNMGLAWSDLGDNKKAVSYLKKALQMKISIYGENTEHPDIAMSLNNLGSAFVQLGDYQRALNCHEKELQMCKTIYSNNKAHPDIARSLNSVGSAWYQLGDYTKAMRYYEQVLQMNKSIYGDSTAHPKIASSLNSLGLAWMHLGDYSKAISYHTQSLELYKRIYGQITKHPDIPDVLDNLGLACCQLGEFKTAVSYYKQSLQMKRNTYGKSTAHPDIASSLDNMGLACAKLGKLKKAVRYYEESLQMKRSIYDSYHPDIAISLNNMGLTWAKLGDFNMAVTYYEESLQMMRSIYGEGTKHLHIAILLNNLGLAWGKLGDYKKALNYYEMSLEIRRSIYGESTPHPDVASSLNNLGSVWFELGDYRKAISYLQQALQMCRSIYGENTAHPDISNSLKNLGLVSLSLGDNRQAISYLEQALQMHSSTDSENISHPGISNSLSSMETDWGHLGDNNKAIRYFEQLQKMKFP